MRLQRLDQREIQKELERMGIVNPATGSAWSLGTINGDIQALEAEWKAKAVEKIDGLKAMQLAELDEVKRHGWAKKDMNTVLRALTLEADIAGTKAPNRSEVSGPKGGPVEVAVLSNEERLARIAELLEAARTRRDGQVAE